MMSWHYNLDNSCLLIHGSGYLGMATTTKLAVYIETVGVSMYTANLLSQMKLSYLSTENLGTNRIHE